MPSLVLGTGVSAVPERFFAAMSGSRNIGAFLSADWTAWEVPKALLKLSWKTLRRIVTAGCGGQRGRDSGA